MTEETKAIIKAEAEKAKVEADGLWRDLQAIQARIDATEDGQLLKRIRGEWCNAHDRAEMAKAL